MEQLPSKMSILFSGILSSHPDQYLQGFRECRLILNHHEFAGKWATSIQRQYQTFMSRSLRNRIFRLRVLGALIPE